MENEQDAQRWTAKRKGALVLSILKGETSIQEAARTNGLTMSEIEDWKARNRKASAQPRAQTRRSQTTMTNTHSANDITHSPCGVDGWGHLVAVINCCDRELIGFEFALRGRAREAEWALKIPPSNVFAHCVRTKLSLLSAVIMALCSRAGIFVKHAVTINLRKCSSRRTRQNRTVSLHASFGV